MEMDYGVTFRLLSKKIPKIKYYLSTKVGRFLTPKKEENIDRKVGRRIKLCP